MKRYQHRQLGTVILIGLAFLAASYALSALRQEPIRFALAFGILILIGFVQLTTSVDEQSVRWSFTLGFPAGEVPVAEIDEAKMTRTNLAEGWGIHWTASHGWLWNVSGFEAVKISYAGGKRVTIGTDDPQGLLAAIEAARDATRS